MSRRLAALTVTLLLAARAPELATLLPTLAEVNQAFVFVNSTDDARALLLRVLVPGEPSRCDA